MLKALEKAQELWADPAELVEQWASDPGKVQEETTIFNILSHIPVEPDSTFADVGCGVGRYADVIKELKPKQHDRDWV